MPAAMPSARMPPTLEIIHCGELKPMMATASRCREVVGSQCGVCASRLRCRGRRKGRARTRGAKTYAVEPNGHGGACKAQALVVVLTPRGGLHAPIHGHAQRLTIGEPARHAMSANRARTRVTTGFEVYGRSAVGETVPPARGELGTAGCEVAARPTLADPPGVNKCARRRGHFGVPHSPPCTCASVA